MHAQAETIIRRISARRIGQHIEYLSDLGPRVDGSPGDHQATEYLAHNLEQAGLRVNRITVPVPVVNDRIDLIKVQHPQPYHVLCTANMRAGLTPPEGITAALVDVDKGLERDYACKDVTGKLALAYESRPYEAESRDQIGWHLEKIHRAANHGAQALIFCNQRSDSFITTWGLWGLDEQIDSVPSVGISYPDLLKLRETAAQDGNRVCLVSTGQVVSGHSDVIWTIIPGTRLPDEVILLIGGHKETVPSCPGANDNASGNAILLELMRVFAENPLDRTLVGLVTCGEESGCWGGKAFLHQRQDWLRDRLKVVMTFDQVVSGDVRLVGHGSARHNQLMIETAAELGYYLRLTNDPADPVACGLGDSQPFVEAGFPGVMMSGWWSDRFYHSGGDTKDKVNPNFAKVWADVIAATAAKIASSD